MSDRRDRSRRTIAVRAGAPSTDGAEPLIPAISQTSVHAHPDLDTSRRIVDHDEPGFTYYRFGHRNGRVLEEAIAAMEGAESAVCTCSGMAAIAAAILSHTASGDHVIIDTFAYGGTRSLCEMDLPRYGISVDFVDLTDSDALRHALTTRTTLVLAESLSNPTLRVPDIEHLAEVLPANVILLVDATFLSPALTQLLAHGAALSVHSIAKYIGGHSVAHGGVVSGAASVMKPGPVMVDPPGHHDRSV